MSAFSEKVAEVVRSIPRGKALSYGEVAMLAGRPGGARAVASALRSLEGIPWWRVTQRHGVLAPSVRELQARKLRQEGARVVEGRIELSLSEPRRGRSSGRRSPS